MIGEFCGAYCLAGRSSGSACYHTRSISAMCQHSNWHIKTRLISASWVPEWWALSYHWSLRSQCFGWSRNRWRVCAKPCTNGSRNRSWLRLRAPAGTRSWPAYRPRAPQSDCVSASFAGSTQSAPRVFRDCVREGRQPFKTLEAVNIACARLELSVIADCGLSLQCG